MPTKMVIESHSIPILDVCVSGSTISTLLHDKINPKNCQVLSLVIQGFSNFLGLFQGIMANPVFFCRKGRFFDMYRKAPQLQIPFFGLFFCFQSKNRSKGQQCKEWQQGGFRGFRLDACSDDKNFPT